MNDAQTPTPTPTPQEARASLEEAGRRAATIRRSDGQLRKVLLLLAALYLADGALLSINPRRGNVLISDALILLFLGVLAGGIYLVVRIRAWSRTGIFWLMGAVAIFLAWNGLVIWVSAASGWWGPDQPGTHLGGSVVVAVLPLLIAAWLVGRR
jgi:hypothetical protein